jgi:hypothetical protein
MTTIMSFFKRPQTLGEIQGRATEGIRNWLTRFAPGLVPERANATADDPSAASWMHRFARDVITANPLSPSRSSLVPIQVYLLELTLEFVDWPALVRDRRLGRLDWSRASLVYPGQCPNGTAGPSVRRGAP